MRYMIPGQAAFEGVWRKPDARDDQIDNLTERIEELERREPREARIAELEAALRFAANCLEDHAIEGNADEEALLIARRALNPSIELNLDDKETK